MSTETLKKRPVKKAVKKAPVATATVADEKPVKTTARKTAAKKTASTPPKKTTARKPAAKTTTKTAAAKTTAKAPAKTKATATGKGRGEWRQYDDHGFMVGTDSSTIAQMVMEGGTDRQDINDRVAKAIGTETRSGNVRNVPALVSGVITRLLDRGYTIESSWQMVPPVKKTSAAKTGTAKRSK